MKPSRKKVQIAVIAAILLLAAVASSKPGRAALVKVISMVRPQPTVTTTTAVAPQTARDVEERARARHGWTRDIRTSVMRGSIIYYDSEEQPTGQWAVSIYRKYPESVRVEISRRDGTLAMGFDGRDAWKTGESAPTPEEARDIRSLIRIWPERLFVTRDSGAGYREAGNRIEELASGEQVFLDQVEMEDEVGQVRSADLRQVYYYVNRDSSFVEAARWLEPDNPARRVDETGVALRDMRADFGSFREAGGVMWPTEITHRSGGRIAFRIKVNEVKVNQPLPDSMFQRSGR